VDLTHAQCVTESSAVKSEEQRSRSSPVMTGRFTFIFYAQNTDLSKPLKVTYTALIADIIVFMYVTKTHLMGKTVLDE